MTALALPDKILALDRALSGVPHAFGGAISLSYHAEPRATIDIDLNVFVSTERAPSVFGPLKELGVAIADAPDKVIRDGQVRVMWGYTPIDLFFSYDPFHDALERDSISVPFADEAIPILSATHLSVCKAVFDRPKDWIDIEAMIELGSVLDASEALRWAARIVGDEDPRFTRLASLLAN